jgi:hypothetical protein
MLLSDMIGGRNTWLRMANLSRELLLTEAEVGAKTSCDVRQALRMQENFL